MKWSLYLFPLDWKEKGKITITYHFVLKVGLFKIIENYEDTKKFSQCGKKVSQWK